MLVVVVAVFFTGGFYVSRLLSLATTTPPWLLRLVKVPTNFDLYLGYFHLFYFYQAFSSKFYRECNSFEWAFFTHRRFLPDTPSPQF